MRNKRFKGFLSVFCAAIMCVAFVGNAFAWGDHDDSSLCPTTNTVIKLGAAYPDTEASGIKGMGKNPQFHGGHAYIIDDGTWSNTKCNYVASYVYLTQVADKYGNSDSLVQIPNTYYNDYQVIKNFFSDNKVGGRAWSTVLSKVTNENKRAFIWGMAIHTLTDVYAHSSFKKLSDGTYKYIAHGSTAPYPADTRVDGTKRFAAACQVARIAIAHYNNNTTGSLYDLVLGSQYYDGSFKIWNLTDYAIDCSNNDAVNLAPALSVAST